MTAGEGFIEQTCAWLRSSSDPWGREHGERLADAIERDVADVKRCDGWELHPLVAMNEADARAALTHWLWRNETADTYCSPEWTRSFSNAAGFYLWAGLTKPITFEGWIEETHREAGARYKAAMQGRSTK